MSEDPLISEMHVDEVTYPGKGVGRIDGLVTFVPGALKGEQVRVKEVHRHKRHRAASLVEVLEYPKLSAANKKIQKLFQILYSIVKNYQFYILVSGSTPGSVFSDLELLIFKKQCMIDEKT